MLKGKAVPPATPSCRYCRWGASTLARHRDVELVVLESGEEIPIDPRWDVVRMKWYGGTLLTILQPSIPPPDDQPLEPT